eukprot:jgi/Bigna1/84927/estExt_fgenesh1_pg.C_10387
MIKGQDMKTNVNPELVGETSFDVRAFFQQFHDSAIYTPEMPLRLGPKEHGDARHNTAFPRSLELWIRNYILCLRRHHPAAGLQKLSGNRLIVLAHSQAVMVEAVLGKTNALFSGNARGLKSVLCLPTAGLFFPADLSDEEEERAWEKSLKATCALATFTLVVVLPLAMCWEVRGGRRLGHGILRNLNVVSNPPKERASKQIRIANPTKLGTIKTYAEEDPWADKTTTSEDDPFQEKTREVLPDGAVLENMEMPKFDDENQEMQFQEEFDAAFQKASWQETRRREEQKMRVRRKIIEDKLRTLEKIEEEEAKQAEDRNKTISSLNSTGAIDHVLKIGE